MKLRSRKRWGTSERWMQRLSFHRSREATVGNCSPARWMRGQIHFRGAAYGVRTRTGTPALKVIRGPIRFRRAVYG